VGGGVLVDSHRDAAATLHPGVVPVPPGRAGAEEQQNQAGAAWGHGWSLMIRVLPGDVAVERPGG
jgi:hypothetical protein